MDQIGFYSDVTANPLLGYGVILGDNWIFGQWEPGFVVKQQKPSIEFLEFFTLCAGVFTWSYSLACTKIIILCDNISVVLMVNNQ